MATVIVSKIFDIVLQRMKRKDEKEDERDWVKDAVMVILHDRLYESCRRYLSEGRVDESGYQNVTLIYNLYHDAGGNGSGTALYNQIESLYFETMRGDN